MWSSTPRRTRPSRPRGPSWTPSSTCTTAEYAGRYDAAVVAKEDGKPHVVERIDRPRTRVVPAWFGGGVLITRQELNEAAEELVADEAGLIVVGEATIEPALDQVFTGTPKVVKREMAASIEQITIELQEAFKG